MKLLWVAILVSVLFLGEPIQNQTAFGQTNRQSSGSSKKPKNKISKSKIKKIPVEKKPKQQPRSKSKKSMRPTAKLSEQHLPESVQVRWREQYGAGVTIGEIAGLNIRMPFQNHHYQFFLASSDSGRNYLFSLDRIFLYPGFLQDVPSAAVYYGAGVAVIKSSSWFKARAGINSTLNIGIGVRVPVGFVLPISRVPIELTAEAGPGFLFAPTAAAFIDAQFGLRVVL